MHGAGRGTNGDRKVGPETVEKVAKGEEGGGKETREDGGEREREREGSERKLYTKCTCAVLPQVVRRNARSFRYYVMQRGKRVQGYGRGSALDLPRLAPEGPHCLWNSGQR